MKKIVFILCIGLASATGVMAQTKDVKQDQKVLKNSIADKKEDKHEVGKDLAHLRIESARNKHKEVRRHRRSIHKQGQHLENHGMKAPIRKAKRQAKADKDAKKGKD
jgi:hypothetical protein